MSDELTFNASDNDAAPDSPISLEMEWKRKTKEKKTQQKIIECLKTIH